MKPFFSIIIPTYNRAEFLSGAVMSILDQGFTDWELLIVDDGSTDNTKAIVNGFKDDRIKYIFQENAERSAARNNGIDNAEGKYICFLDSDDLFERNHLSELHKFIFRNNNEVTMYFTGASTLKNGVINKSETPTNNDFNPPFFLENAIIPARVSIHRDIFNKFKFDDRCIIVEDTVLWCEIAAEYSVKYLDKPTIVYHLHDENSVNNKRNNAYKKRIKGLKILFNHKPVGKILSRATKNKQYINCYFGMARHQALNNNKLKAIFYLIRSLTLNIKTNPRKKEAILGIYKVLTNQVF